MFLTVRAKGGGILARSKYGPDRIRFSELPGRYLVIVEAPGYEVQTKEIAVTQGRTEQVTFDLKPTWKPLLLQRIFRSR